tara:strand:- start:16309 stop:16728 length:420 start_codon:yes stop_codon:yes gene_type:complete
MNKVNFEGILTVCETHAERLSYALSRLSEKHPFTPFIIQELNDVDLAFCDQFLSRYSKLQDLMGTKLLPAVLELTYEEGELRSSIDKLNRLEKIGAISSASEWLELREMRNQLAHDDPDDPEIQSSLLNKALQKCAAYS